MPKKAGGNLLTRKIGPFPGYVWGLGAAGIGVIYFYMVGKQPGGTGSTPAGSAQNNPAASSMPFVPSVTVTGLAPNTGAGTTSPQSSGQSLGLLTLRAKGEVHEPAQQGYDSSHGALPLYDASSGTIREIGSIPYGITVPVAGTAVSARFGSQVMSWIPVTYSGQVGFISPNDITSLSQSANAGAAGGSGGPGIGGAGVPMVTAMMGWTSGWTSAPGSAGWPLTARAAAGARRGATASGGRGDSPVGSDSGSGGSDDAGSGGGLSAKPATRTAGRVRTPGKFRLQRRLGTR